MYKDNRGDVIMEMQPKISEETRKLCNLLHDKDFRITRFTPYKVKQAYWKMKQTEREIKDLDKNGFTFIPNPCPNL